MSEYIVFYEEHAHLAAVATISWRAARGRVVLVGICVSGVQHGGLEAKLPWQPVECLQVQAPGDRIGPLRVRGREVRDLAHSRVMQRLQSTLSPGVVNHA